MIALISGQAGIAVLADNSNYWSVSVEEPDRRKPCAADEVHYLFGGANDVTSVDDASEEAVIQQLEDAWQMDRALQMVLILLSGEEDLDIRESSADCLDEFLENQSVYQHVNNRLHEYPLPADANIGEAVEIASANGFAKVQSLLSEVDQRQAEIRAVCHAFDLLEDQHFEVSGFANKSDARRWLSDHGVFHRLASATGPTIGNELMKLLLDPEVGQLANARQFLPKWIAPLKSPAPTMDYSVGDSAKSHQQPKQSVPRAPKRSREERKELADRQLQEILELFDGGEEPKAIRWAEELYQRQVNIGDTGYAVMSMSNLASAMKKRRRHDLQFQFAQIATSSKFADAQSFCQLADALLQKHDPMSALRQYDETISRFPANEVAQCGRAEVLRKLNRHEDALQQYDDTIRQFPTNEVSRNGRAEVLRVLNRHEDALQQYDDTIRQFPTDEVAQCGRAEVLRELNRHEDALKQYDDTIRQFPTNEVAQCGRAEVLRELNRHEDALKQYDDTIRQFPTDEVAQCGRAEVLRKLNRHEDALQQYDDTIRQFPTDEVSRNGRAEVLRVLNRHEDALQQYDDTISQFPTDEVAQCGRAEVLRELNRHEDALKQYDDTIRQFPTNEVARCGRAEVLRELNRHEDALQQYDDTIRQFPNDRVAKNGRAVLLMRLERYDDALTSLGAIKTVTQDDWIDHHVRGMIHLAKGEFQEAIEIFEFGVTNCPLIRSVPYFKSALAIARLRMNDAKRALEAIADESNSISEVIRMHAFGLQNNRTQCEQSYAKLQSQTDHQISEVRTLLFEGYVSEKASSVRTRQWEEEVFRKETELLLRHAA